MTDELKQELKDYFKGSVCIVTGGDGLIGRQVMTILQNLGAIAINVSNRTAGDPFPDPYHLVLDLTDICQCRQMLNGFGKSRVKVFHLAGRKGTVLTTDTTKVEMFLTNLMVTTNVLEACREGGIQDVVFTSSVGAYPPYLLGANQEPVSPSVLKECNGYGGWRYMIPPMDGMVGWAKRIGEWQIDLYREQFGLNYAAVRLTSCFGPGDNFDVDTGMVIPSLMAKVKRGDDPIEVWGDGSTVRDFLYSKDAAWGIIMAMYRKPERFINLGSGGGCTILGLVQTLAKVVPFNWTLDPEKPTGVQKRVLDITEARDMGWEPQYSLEEALKETWEEFCNEQRNSYQC